MTNIFCEAEFCKFNVNNKCIKDVITIKNDDVNGFVSIKICDNYDI